MALLSRRLARILLFLGPLVAVAAWLVILVSWWLNHDWFNYTRDAFSDLAAREAAAQASTTMD